MSRTREVTRNDQGPAKVQIYFNGKKGSFGYRPEDGEDGDDMVNLPWPFRFIVLDDHAHQVSGRKSLDKDAPRWKSNLAHEAYSTHLNVWLSTDAETILAQGSWGSMKGRMYDQGARYEKLLYILTDFGQGKVMACLHLKGRAYSAWIDATGKKKIDPCGPISFSVKGTVMMSGKGDDSAVPVFEIGKISEETDALAKDACEILDEWLDKQFENPYVMQAPAETKPEPIDTNIRAEPSDETWATPPEPYRSQMPAELQPAIVDNLDDLPF